MRLPVDASQARPDEAITCEADQFWPTPASTAKRLRELFPRGDTLAVPLPHISILST
jgi:hypothetical protein